MFIKVHRLIVVVRVVACASLFDHFSDFLFQTLQHSVPKAAPELAADPSTPPASIRKVHWQYNSSVLATSLPIETTAPIVTVLDDGEPKKREAAQIIFHRWP